MEKFSTTINDIGMGEEILSDFDNNVDFAENSNQYISETIWSESTAVSNLLKEWNLQHLYPIITSNKLDIISLLHMKERHFDQIIFETIGDKIKFEHFVDTFQKQQLKLNNDYAENVSVEKNQNQCEHAAVATASELSFKTNSVRFITYLVFFNIIC